jgi:pimeloyl-ACP methyl ester carboxylesterase
MRRILLFLTLFALPAAAQAPVPPVLDLAALPTLEPAGRQFYEQRFLLGNLRRAFAVSPDGKYGGNWSAHSAEEARANALKGCTGRGGKGCVIYAEDLDVVWPGRPRVARAVPPGPLLAGEGWAFVPDERYFWRGPAAARGVVVFAHGYMDGVESFDGQPPPYIRAFNNAGFDVVRFARHAAYDYRSDDMAQHLREGLREMRQLGWKTVVSAGQSRGAWNNLQALDTPDLADAVIAVSPAKNGTDSSAQVLMGNTALWSITGDARAARTQVAFVQFVGDPFYTDGDKRVAIINRLQGRVAALLAIDRPDGFTGHGGGNTAAFAERFGACLLRFATAPSPPTGC